MNVCAEFSPRDAHCLLFLAQMSVIEACYLGRLILHDELRKCAPSVKALLPNGDIYWREVRNQPQELPHTFLLSNTTCNRDRNERTNEKRTSTHQQ